MITITPHTNGPLQVDGLSQIKTSKGTKTVEAESYFCRCGGSENKPFCDGSHKKRGYSSERETKRDLNKVHHYEGEEITIHDNRTLCSHSEICVKQLSTVFNRNSRPWIDPLADRTEAIIELIKKCPSGALSYTLNDEHHNQFHNTVEFEVCKNGPYHVKGPVQLNVTDELQIPSKDHFAICRCGESKNKPYCDGNHHTAKFIAD